MHLKIIPPPTQGHFKDRAHENKTMGPRGTDLTWALTALTGLTVAALRLGCAWGREPLFPSSEHYIIRVVGHVVVWMAPMFQKDHWKHLNLTGMNYM